MTKIYLANYLPDKIKNKMPILEPFLKKEINYSILYSEDQGLFKIEKNNIYQLYPIDFPITTDDKNNFIIDKSYFKEERIYQIPFNHIKKDITQFYYCIGKEERNKPTLLYLVIEGFYEKPQQFISTNFYFETDENIDSHFLKEELNNMLNLIE
jgi:hypothetical protein